MDADARLLVACLDLTSLGDRDDTLTIDALCDRAVAPAPRDPTLRVAAVCVLPRFVPRARGALEGTGVRVACATGGFPDAASDLGDRLDEVRAAVRDGADEVDVVVNRRLAADAAALHTELEAMRSAAGAATWKAILETGALAPDELPVVSVAAIEAGADFLKTSTGKGPPGATMEAVAALASIVADAGANVGIKVSGGVRTAADAAGFLEVIRERLGTAWIEPSRFRIGASSLVDGLTAS